MSNTKVGRELSSFGGLWLFSLYFIIHRAIVDACSWWLLLILVVQTCCDFLTSVDSLHGITFNVVSSKSSSSYYVFTVQKKVTMGHSVLSCTLSKTLL